MRWGIVLLLVASAGCDLVFTVEEPRGACPVIFGVDRYKYNSTPEVWLVAAARCAQLDNDPDDLTFTHLAVTSSELEVNSVRYPNDFVEAWVGLTDRVVRDDWHWVTDEAVEQIPWGVTEPDDTATQRCGRVDVSDYTVHDSSCNEPKAYVCECDEFPIDPTHIE